MTVTERVSAVVGSKPVTGVQVAQEIGCCLRVTSRAISHLVDKGVIRSERLPKRGPDGSWYVYSKVQRSVPLLQQVWRGVHDAPLA